MRSALFILLFTAKLFACASSVELASAVVDSATEQERLQDLETLIAEFQAWDAFLDGKTSRMGNLVFEDATPKDRKDLFRIWLRDRQAEKVYAGNFRLGDYLGNFDVISMFDSKKRKKRIEALVSLATIQSFNVFMENWLAREIGEGRTFRTVKVDSFDLMLALRRHNLEVDYLLSLPTEFFRFAEKCSDKPTQAVIQRYRLLITAIGVAHLATVERNIDTILAQKGIVLTRGQKHFQRFHF